MNMNQTLLVELQTEELPPKALGKLGDAFAAGIAQWPEGARLPRRRQRRHHLRHAAPAGRVDRKVRGPRPTNRSAKKCCRSPSASTRKARPTAPLAKKLAALAASPHNCPKIARPGTRAGRQGRELLLYLHRAGASLADGLQAVLQEAVAKLPIPKVMSYQRPDGSTVQFVRPVHKLLALHGDDVIPVAARPGPPATRRWATASCRRA
jgi:glycyl-tRNA synthetase beta chain